MPRALHASQDRNERLFQGGKPSNMSAASRAFSTFHNLSAMSAASAACSLAFSIVTRSNGTCALPVPVTARRGSTDARACFGKGIHIVFAASGVEHVDISMMSS